MPGTNANKFTFLKYKLESPTHRAENNKWGEREGCPYSHLTICCVVNRKYYEFKHANSRMIAIVFCHTIAPWDRVSWFVDMVSLFHGTQFQRFFSFIAAILDGSCMSPPPPHNTWKGTQNGNNYSHTTLEGSFYDLHDSDSAYSSFMSCSSLRTKKELRIPSLKWTVCFCFSFTYWDFSWFLELQNL